MYRLTLNFVKTCFLFLALSQTQLVLSEDNAVNSSEEIPTQTALESLLASLANQEFLEIPFTEVQVNPLLETPIESIGLLIYEPNERALSKITTSPNPSSFHMNDTHIVISQNGKERKIRLSKSKQLRAIFTSIRGLIEGDKEAIEQYFDIQFSNEEDAWLIQLQPNQTSLAKELDQIEVIGNESRVNTIRTISPNGNLQTMSLNYSSSEMSNVEMLEFGLELDLDLDLDLKAEEL